VVELAVSVVGMSCRHCVAGVTEELRRLPGVADVSVELGDATSTVIITSDGPLARAAVARAIDEAGYRMAG
jgi:copper chaperone CopZ